MKSHVQVIAGGKCAELHRANFGDVRNEVTEQILDAVAQRCG